MSFLSVQFSIFLLAGLIVFYLVPVKWRKHVLLLLSGLFYILAGTGWGLGVLVVTATAVYFAALAIDRGREKGGKGPLVAVTLAGLALVLAAFKCAGMFQGALLNLLAQGGLDATILLMAPLGLSYYLFKLASYVLDVYWENSPVERDPVALLLYTAFFPQIVTGPIQRSGDFLTQVHAFGLPDQEAMAGGLRRILFGVFKILIIANPLALVVARVHRDPSSCSPPELLLGIYAFALQLYAEFSGMTDLALGIGRLFGLKGPENFQRPYWTPNVQEFWRRWHISLTSWLADYLFTPLRMAFRRWGNPGLWLAILINMVAVALWHRPTLQYAVYGAVNGVFMIVSVMTLKKRNAFFRNRPGLARIRRITAPLLTFHLLIFAFVLFRADSLALAGEYYRHLLPGMQGPGVPLFRVDVIELDTSKKILLGVLLSAVVMEFIHWARDNKKWRQRFLNSPRWVRWGLYYTAILVIWRFGSFVVQKSMYEQF